MRGGEALRKDKVMRNRGMDFGKAAIDGNVLTLIVLTISMRCFI